MYPADSSGRKEKTASAPARSPLLGTTRTRCAPPPGKGFREAAPCDRPPLLHQTDRPAGTRKGRAQTGLARVRLAGGVSTHGEISPARPAGGPDNPEPRAHPKVRWAW